MNGHIDIAEVDGGNVEARPSVFHYLDEGMRRSLDSPAIISTQQPAAHLSKLTGVSPTQDICLQWTYRQLHGASCRLARAFLQSNIKAGAGVVTSFMPNGIEYALLWWTCHLLKLTLANLDVSALQPSRAAELEGYIRDMRPDVVVIPTNTDGIAFDAIRTATGLGEPCVKLYVSAGHHGDNESNGWKSVEDYCMSIDPSPPTAQDEDSLVEAAKNDSSSRVCVVLFTSGSTGKPKGCPRTVSEVLHMLEGYRHRTPRGRDTRYLLQTANFRGIALSTMMSTLSVGGTVIIPCTTFDPRASIDAILGHGATNMIIVPYHLLTLINHPDFYTKGVPDANMNLVDIGADMITRDLLSKARAAFPSASRISNSHGMTEGGGLFTWPYGNKVESIPCIQNICTLGFAAKGAKLRITASEDDSSATGVALDTSGRSLPPMHRILKRGERGELHVCSKAFSTRYLNNEKPQDFYRDETTGEQWFRTGDLGLIDHGGEIYILGRIKDVIKRAGVPITPAALENSICEILGGQCSLIGVPHPTLGSDPYAVVSGFPSGISEQDIKDKIVAEFGKDYAVGRVLSLQNLGLETFPINSTGKIMKSELLKVVLQKITE